MRSTFESAGRIARPALLLLGLVGCQGTGPEPASAPPPDPAQGPAATPNAPAIPPPAPEAAPTPPDEPMNDRASILQAVLDGPELQQFLHPEVSGRVPVIIVETPAVEDKPSLSKFDAPVTYRGRKDLTEDDAALEFTRVDIEGDRATVDFSYEIEGVTGHAEATRGDDGWTLQKLSVSEH